MTETKTRAVKHLSIQLMDAWKSQDFETLNLLLHKDFQFVSMQVSGYRYNKLQWLDVALNKYKIYHYRYDFLNLTESENVAVCVSRLSILSSVSFNEQSNNYLVTDVWKNSQGNWKILLRQPVLIM
ncbi:MAG TPA: nuclear transport factor 2 family protein [Chitinophagaceae bacterium]|nr:nuclear transport factor 2 family protein [Chitinophagaceae bacterium]